MEILILSARGGGSVALARRHATFSSSAAWSTLIGQGLSLGVILCLKLVLYGPLCHKEPGKGLKMGVF